MNHPPVNAFNTNLVTELTDILRTLEETKTIRGVVITSSLPHIFSGGLDISELYIPTTLTEVEREEKRLRLRRFCDIVVDFSSRFYTTPLVTMAAINGTAPAGGCALANVLDYRVMADTRGAVIGLNESHLGVAVPLPAARAYANILGHRGCERHLSLGTLMGPREALRVGLVDEVVVGDELMGRVCEQMERWLCVQDVGRVRTKQMLRGVRSEAENRNLSEKFFEVICESRTQESIAKYYEALRKKI